MKKLLTFLLQKRDEDQRLSEGYNNQTDCDKILKSSFRASYHAYDNVISFIIKEGYITQEMIDECQQKNNKKSLTF